MIQAYLLFEESQLFHFVKSGKHGIYFSVKSSYKLESNWLFISVSRKQSWKNLLENFHECDNGCSFTFLSLHFRMTVVMAQMNRVSAPNLSACQVSSSAKTHTVSIHPSSAMASQSVMMVQMKWTVIGLVREWHIKNMSSIVNFVLFIYRGT
jgi:hypothetical protein